MPMGVLLTICDAGASDAALGQCKVQRHAPIILSICTKCNHIYILVFSFILY